MDPQTIIGEIGRKMEEIKTDLAALVELWQTTPHAGAESVRLEITWLSQIDNTAVYARGDCAMACVAMLLRARGEIVTVVDVSKASGLLEGFIGAGWWDAQRAAAHFALHLEHAADLTLETLLVELRAGRPVICIVNYQSIPKLLRYNELYNAGHFVLAVGFDADHILVHDPYWPAEPAGRGAFLPYPRTDFMNAWTALAPGNKLKCQVLRVAP